MAGIEESLSFSHASYLNHETKLTDSLCSTKQPKLGSLFEITRPSFQRTIKTSPDSNLVCSPPTCYSLGRVLQSIYLEHDVRVFHRYITPNYVEIPLQRELILTGECCVSDEQRNAWKSDTETPHCHAFLLDLARK